ncbi:hypothetical protein COT94_03870 [Candidatus Falkowbacteria bacterium CG10_big_fil_rev_8_21_14_0_10_37_14]|uniref:Uncharacterized protein n=1 Tax=Candidatus Falkowbacteria bacterium CG10_big_fil_rev_8_21_14_0_10_37_14 TaxID=1974561 RepID=A0A2M6WSB6_9BACT|nr:hypothetical protein [Candidatus Falkowbacteria bacterium]PIT95699.1 MAG: hypothetical protein COT94_03870 [Candidatus Falkowbacteria bacterium CG10_big_fil_rev_8_21_14_0_10_37_14]
MNIKQWFNKTVGAWSAHRFGLKNDWVDFLATRSVTTHLLLSGGLNFIIWLLAILIFYRAEQSLLIIHYNILFGIDWVASKPTIFWLPGIGLIVFVMNTVLSWWASKYDDLSTHLLLGGAVVVNLFLLLAITTIWSINYINLVR